MYLPQVSYKGKHVASVNYHTDSRYNTTRARSRRRSAAAPLLSRGQFILSIIAMTLTLLVIWTAASKAIHNDTHITSSRPTFLTSMTGNAVNDLNLVISDVSFPDLSVSNHGTTMPVVEDVVEETPEPIVEEAKYEPIETTRLGITVDRYDYNVDYTKAISEAYALLDNEGVDPTHVLALCEIYEAQRNIKILDNDMDFEVSNLFTAENSYEDIDAVMHPHVAWTEYTEQDVIDLACIIYAEAGAYYCTDRHQQAVGSVVVNRWKSPKWDDNSIREVIDHEGQYPNTRSNRTYDERAYRNALYVLEYGPLYEDAVWQANFEQGTYLIEKFDYTSIGKSITYICGGYVYD